MPLSNYGPEELEPFLSVYDKQNRSSQLVREPAFAARLQGIYDNPVSSDGYTYGRAIGGREKALQNLATAHSGIRAREQVQTDLKKDAARRNFIANQAQLAQQLENIRGRGAGAFANALTQAIGAATAPIRPGGERHGEFRQALEAEGLREEERRRFIRDFFERHGRLPGPGDWRALNPAGEPTGRTPLGR